jgi:hypothetical protein
MLIDASILRLPAAEAERAVRARADAVGVLSRPGVIRDELRRLVTWERYGVNLVNTARARYAAGQMNASTYSRVESIRSDLEGAIRRIEIIAVQGYRSARRAGTLGAIPGLEDSGLAGREATVFAGLSVGALLIIAMFIVMAIGWPVIIAAIVGLAGVLALLVAVMAQAGVTAGDVAAAAGGGLGFSAIVLGGLGLAALALWRRRRGGGA